MLIVIAGPLGAGKTTLATLLANRINGEYISIDKVLKDNGLDSIPEGSFCIPLVNFLKANQYMLPSIHRAQSINRPVVVDGCFYHREAYEDLALYVKPPIFAYTLHLPLSMCIQRDRNREHPLGEEAARGVYSLTSKLEIGKVIDATLPVLKNVEHIMKDLAL